MRCSLGSPSLRLAVLSVTALTVPAGLGMAGTQDYKDSPVSSSHKARRPSEPGIASPRGSLLSTRGGRNAPGSPRASVSAGLGQSPSPNAASGEYSPAHAFLLTSAWQMLCAMLPKNSLGSTWLRQQQHYSVSGMVCLISASATSATAGSLRSTLRRQQHHQPRATISAAGHSRPTQSPHAGRRNMRQSVSQGAGAHLTPSRCCLDGMADCAVAAT